MISTAATRTHVDKRCDLLISDVSLIRHQLFLVCRIVFSDNFSEWFQTVVTSSAQVACTQTATCILVSSRVYKQISCGLLFNDSNCSEENLDGHSIDYVS
jgi:hypothetical protein